MRFLKVPFFKARSARAALVCLGFLLAFGLPRTTWADADEAFRKAIQAADRGRWEEATERLREAIAEDSQESERRVLISGVFSRPYLPHFFLGQALLQRGQDHCEEALESWNTSKAQGAIQNSKAQFQQLEEGLRNCNGLLLPPAISAATREIERAAALDNRLPDPLPDPALNTEVQVAREALAEARRYFESGRAAMRFTDLREAESRARTAGQKLAAIEGKIQQAQRRLSDAVTAARKTVAEAERVEGEFAEQLAEPQHAAAWRQAGGWSRTEALRPRLRAARDGLNNAEDLPAVVAVKSAAEAILVEYRQAQTQLAAALSANPSARTPEVPSLATRPAFVPAPATATAPPPDRSSSATSPPPDTPADQAVGEALSQDAFRQLITDAERLLSRLPADSPSELLEIQTSRLTLLLREGREPTAQDAARLHQRMASSLEALRLLAGAQAYLTGQAEEAVRILDNHEIPAGPLAAQTHLFLAASSFALYHTRGAAEPSLLQDATDAARQAHGFDPTLILDRRVFSPSFLKFFDAAVNNRH